MENHLATTAAHSPMEDPPPHPPPRTPPPDPPRTSPVMPIPTSPNLPHISVPPSSTAPPTSASTHTESDLVQPIQAPQVSSSDILSTQRQGQQSSTVSDGSLMSARGTMTILSWNCQGSGGRLSNSKMVHLACLMTSTNSQVSFISETRSSTITRTSLINRFNAYDAFVVPAIGQSGGLWLI
jgi:hypothetical protein